MTPWHAGEEAKTLVDNLGDVDINSLNNTLPEKLAQVKTGTYGDTLGNVEAEALLDALAQKQADPLGERPAGKKVKNLGRPT